jgi:hypothetical protein
VTVRACFVKLAHRVCGEIAICTELANSPQNQCAAGDDRVAGEMAEVQLASKARTQRPISRAPPALIRSSQ